MRTKNYTKVKSMLTDGIIRETRDIIFINPKLWFCGMILVWVLHWSWIQVVCWIHCSQHC